MPNYAILSIPAYYFFSLIPHAYAVMIANSAPTTTNANRKEGGWNNANPHSALTATSLQRLLPPALYARYERSERAHRNNIENVPLFAAAVLAGVLAQKLGDANRDPDVRGFAAGWFAVRVLYTLLYINTETERWSHVRSWTYMAGTGWAFYQLYKAAVALA